MYLASFRIIGVTFYDDIWSGSPAVSVPSYLSSFSSASSSSFSATVTSISFSLPSSLSYSPANFHFSQSGLHSFSLSSCSTVSVVNLARTAPGIADPSQLLGSSGVQADNRLLAPLPSGSSYDFPPSVPSVYAGGNIHCQPSLPFMLHTVSDYSSINRICGYQLLLVCLLPLRLLRFRLNI